MLTVVALLVGLLGMHGLAGHHTMTRSAMTSSAMTSSAVTSSGITPAARSGTTVDRFGVVTPPNGGWTGGVGSACLAVLGTALLLTLARVRRRPPRVPDGRSASPVPFPAGVRQVGVPPDLVAGLCVSRT